MNVLILTAVTIFVHSAGFLQRKRQREPPQPGCASKWRHWTCSAGPAPRGAPLPSGVWDGQTARSVRWDRGTPPEQGVMWDRGTGVTGQSGRGDRATAGRAAHAPLQGLGAFAFPSALMSCEAITGADLDTWNCLQITAKSHCCSHLAFDSGGFL